MNNISEKTLIQYRRSGWLQYPLDSRSQTLNSTIIVRDVNQRIHSREDL